jgi:putative transposase
MPRSRRIVIPGIPHHITQRGNYRQKTFFSDQDYQFYLDLLQEFAPGRKTGTDRMSGLAPIQRR